MKTEAEKLTKKINSLRNTISIDAGSSLMDLINELVDAEIELEALCNQ